MNTEANKESVLPTSCEPIYTKEQLENAIAQERERITKLIHQFRDDCAIRALESLIIESDLPKDQKEIDRQTKKAYRYADDMLKAKFK